MSSGRNRQEQSDALEARSTKIQALVKSQEEKDLQELIDFLKYRRMSKAQKRQQIERTALNSKEKDDFEVPVEEDSQTRLVKEDLDTAVLYLTLTATDPLLELYSGKLHMLANQIQLEKEAAKISNEDLPTLTEFIYRVVYQAKVQCGQEDPNPLNEKRGAELATYISKHPKLQIFGGVCLFIFGLGLAVGAAASLIVTLGLSAPVSGPLAAVGFFGMSGGGYKFNKGRKAMSARAAVNSEEGVPFSLLAFFKPENRASITIPDQTNENASLVPNVNTASDQLTPETSPVYHTRYIQSKRKGNGYFDEPEEGGSISINHRDSMSNLPSLPSLLDFPRVKR